MERAIILSSQLNGARPHMGPWLRRPPSGQAYPVPKRMRIANSRGWNWPRREFSNNLGVYAAQLGNRRMREMLRADWAAGAWAARWDAQGTQMGYQDMSDDFEDHCWKDVVTP